MTEFEYMDTEIQIRTRIQTVVSAGGLTDFTRQQLVDTMFNPVSIYWPNGAMEVIYAAGDGLPLDAKILGIQAADIMEKKGFMGKAERAASIKQTMLRELGNQVGPDKSLDVAVDPEFEQPKPEVEPEPAPVPEE